jgi:hypothetical protein
MRTEELKKIINKPLSRRGWVYVNKLAWAFRKSLENQQEDILRKHCEVKPKRVFDPLTGEVNLKYNPNNVDEDYYIT